MYISHRRREALCSLASVLALGLCAASLLAPQSVRADSLTFSTEDHPIGPGPNQGWWAPVGTAFSNIDPNKNIDLIDQTANNLRLRNFFTFFIAPYAGSAESAMLVFAPVTSAAYSPLNEATETIGFFDVSTPAATLNFTQGQSNAIYNDLGSGVQYGSAVVSENAFPDTVLIVKLNASALAAIDAARGGYFSIGGALLTSDGDDSMSFGGPIVKLNVQTAPLPPAATAGIVLMGGLAFRRRSRRDR